MRKSIEPTKSIKIVFEIDNWSNKLGDLKKSKMKGKNVYRIRDNAKKKSN